MVGAAVALTALGAFVWYRSRIKRQSMYYGKGAPTEAPPPMPLRTVSPRAAERGGGSQGGGQDADWMRYYPNLRQQNLYE